MIYVTSNGKNFTVSLDKGSNHYRVCYALIKSLLTVSEPINNNFVIDYEDFLYFKSRLDELNLTEGRFMDDLARDAFLKFVQEDQLNLDTKNGLYNDRVKYLLEGKLKTEPYEDQWTGISYLTLNRRSGLFDTMGVGKTLQALGAICTEPGRSLVIAPASVLLDFSKEIKKHTYLTPLVVPSGRKKALQFIQKNLSNSWDILLINPESLVNADSKSREVLGEISLLLAKTPFSYLIIDEFHMYKNIDAKRSQCIVHLAEKIKDDDKNLCKLIIMTGTPVSESPTNAYVALSLLSSSYLPHIQRFEEHFVQKTKIKIKQYDARTKKPVEREVDKVIGFKNLNMLRDRVHRYSIRRTKEQMKGFPDRVIINRTLTLEGNQLSLYSELRRFLIKDLKETEKGGKLKLSQFLADNHHAVKLRQILNHPSIIGESGDSAKYIEIDNILEQIFSDPSQKVIIWTAYRKAVDLIYDRWNEQYGVIKIYGGVDVNQKMADTFNYDPNVRIAACIPEKAGTGVDFLARARTAIYIDRPYSFTLYSQSLDRIHRRVKTEGELTELDKIRSQKATIIFLDVEGSIDELIRDSLSNKSSMVDAVTDTEEFQILKSEMVDKYLK